MIDDLRPGAAAKRRKKARKDRAPRPQNERLSASLERSQTQGIAEMFDEADRRDPERQRTAIVLIDGEERRRDRRLILVLDIIHVLHYLLRNVAISLLRLAGATRRQRGDFVRRPGSG